MSVKVPFQFSHQDNPRIPWRSNFLTGKEIYLGPKGNEKKINGNGAKIGWLTSSCLEQIVYKNLPHNSIVFSLILFSDSFVQHVEVLYADSDCF